MTMTISGSGTITGLTAGGLPDATITQAEIATPVAGTGPAFSAYGTALQASANNTYTKIAFNTEEFDTNSNYDTSAYRFTPTVAGYYQINATIQYGASATNRIIIFIYKNGSIFKRGNALQNSATGPLQGVVSALVYANGTSDYFEIYGWQNSGGSFNIGSDSSDFAFSGVLVRAA